MAGSYTLYEMYNQKNPYTGQTYNNYSLSPAADTSKGNGFIGAIGAGIGGLISPTIGSLTGNIAGNYLTGLLGGGGTGGSVSSSPTTTTTTTGTHTPPPPDLRPTMDYQAALAQAQGQMNPLYDTMRGRAERQYSDQREYAPQLLGAKYSAAGIRGGRRESMETQLTQKENQAMQDLESERQAKTYELAGALQSKDAQMASQAYRDALAGYNASQDNQFREKNLQVTQNMARDQRTFDWVMKLLGIDQENQQFDKEFGLKSNSLQNSPEYRDLYLQKMGLDNAQSQYNLDNPRRTGGSGGLTPAQDEASKQKMMSWIDDKVKNDQRLLPNYSNYAALQDAWQNMYYTLYPG